MIFHKTELFGKRFCTLWQIIWFFGLCEIKLEILKQQKGFLVKLDSST